MSSGHGPDATRVDASQRRHAAHESNDFSPKATHAVRVQIVNGPTVECAWRGEYAEMTQVLHEAARARFPRCPQGPRQASGRIASARRIRSSMLSFASESAKARSASTIAGST